MQPHHLISCTCLISRQHHLVANSHMCQCMSQVYNLKHKKIDNRHHVADRNSILYLKIITYFCLILFILLCHFSILLLNMMWLCVTDLFIFIEFSSGVFYSLHTLEHVLWKNIGIERYNINIIIIIFISLSLLVIIIWCLEIHLFLP